MERILENQSSSQFKKFLQTAPTLIEKSDKIVLSEKQIEQFDRLAEQVMRGSITIDEAVLKLRGGNELTDLAVILAFVIFANWLDSLYGVEPFQQSPLPHMDPMD
jgi:hypothetical protein